ncbi:MAG: 50S ribosomal protein L28 [Actinobacteria bacterium]|nr:50S ribosomal protein L28 [Actinomycetota bacterium]
MSRICAVCWKTPSFGNNRSHSMRATPRRWNVNVQKVRILLKGRPVRAYVCAKCLKANKVQKAV